MKTKTSELIGAALDWAVAEAQGVPQSIDAEGKVHDAELVEFGCDGGTLLRYSTDWARGGPIIERERIGFQVADTGAHYQAWGNTCIEWASWPEGAAYAEGPTPLVAAMRCLVASKFGEEVDVPAEVMEGAL